MTLKPVCLVGEPVELELTRPEQLADDYVLSPYVVRWPPGYAMLLRLVNRDDQPAKKVSRVYYAESTDGIHFAVRALAIAPGNVGESDDGGCEDPTIVRDRNGWTVFYSGYERKRRLSHMLCAKGDDLAGLRKSGQLLSDDAFANAKEAAVLRLSQGYRLFFEYATGGASRIGVVDAPSLDGPWLGAHSPIEPREEMFDAWHLSPCSSVRRVDGSHVLFYNGSTRITDWRIGWAILDSSGTTVIDRADVPLIAPFGLEQGDTDIAFAASTVLISPDTVAIYYSISDRRLYRSLLRIEGAVADSGLQAEGE